MLMSYHEVMGVMVDNRAGAERRCSINSAKSRALLPVSRVRLSRDSDAKRALASNSSDVKPSDSGSYKVAVRIKRD